MMRTVAALIRKDAALERRTFDSLPAMLMFTIGVFVLFRFGLNRTALEGQLAAGVLLVTLLLAAVLGMGRLFVSEREQGGFDGFLLAPVQRNAMLFAKVAVLFAFLVCVEVIAVAAFSVLLLAPDVLPALPGLIAVLLLCNLGIAVVGTLVGALGVMTRARELIVPLLALPLLLPLAIGAAQATAPLLAATGVAGLEWRWLGMLALYDGVFGLLAYAVFDFLLEE